MSIELSNRDTIFLKDPFGKTTTSRIANLMRFLDRHGASDTADRYLQPLITALEEYPKSKRPVSDPSRWNTRVVLSANETMTHVDLRKPRITVDHEINNRGTFKVTWEPTEFDAREFDFIRSPLMDDHFSTLLRIPHFEQLLAGFEHGEDDWQNAVMTEIAETYLSAANEIVADLSLTCDVTIGCRLRPTMKGHYINELRIVDRFTAEEEDAAVEAALEARREAARAEWAQRSREAAAQRQAAKEEAVRLEKEQRVLTRDAKHAACEERYGISPEQIVGVCDSFRTLRVSMALRIEILCAEFGMNRPTSEQAFETDIRVMTDYLRRHDLSPGDPYLMPEIAVELKDTYEDKFPALIWDSKKPPTDAEKLRRKLNKRIAAAVESSPDASCPKEVKPFPKPNFGFPRR